ncbi:ATP-binding protein [Lentimicrobium sp. S6]|uniref:hybrid sensor histidine kinase/response regulator transcription factor n=1 Tax=Lentimicrobium sp. S6 TaxID=2735872 RepID=UPI0015525EF8|nr:ATP-binding protein [Lentimicrobium sp. S6]NPD46646.1 response regulator [Lentimicrobium sp. S6]
MKTITFKIFFVLAFLAGFNIVFPNTFIDIIKLKPQLKPRNIKSEEMQSFYDGGIYYYNNAEYIYAEQAFLKVINTAEKPQDKKILSYSFHFLGNIESWKSNFSQSIYYHKKAHKLFLELKNSEYVAISNNKISFGFTSLGEYDSTLVYCQSNIKNRKLIEANYAVLNSYKVIAGTYARLYNYKLSYQYLQEAIEYAEELGDNQSLGEMYLTAGLLFLNNHVNKDIALEYLLEAQGLFEDQKNKIYINLTKLQIGDVYFKTGNDTLAMKYYNEVIASTRQSNYAMLSAANHKIGMVFKEGGEYEKALEYLQKSIDGMCKVCPEIQIHQTLIEAARTSIITGDSAQAFIYLNRSKNIASESESRLEMAISYKELGIYYQLINNNDSSIYYLELSHHLAIDLGLPKRIKTTAELLSEKYYLNGKYKTASNYLKMAIQMNDSLASIEKYNEVAKLEMRFEIEKKEAEISKQKLLRNSFIGGAFLLVIFGLMLWRAYRNKKKDNQLLAEQKAEIQEISNILQQSTKRKLDFFTNISHEIRTPLTLIKSPLERILKSETQEEEIGNQLQLAIKNTNKLKSLVNQILDLQKLDEDLLCLDLSEFEIISFCKEIVASFEGYSSQNHCKLIFEANIAKAQIKFDQGRLQSIITNLLSNAFKFNKENGEVDFKLHLNQQQLGLEISDTGKGMNGEHIKKLGERYYQIEDSNTNVEGSGIGLAYVKEIVALAKGKFSVSSEPGKGTDITISLPLESVEIQEGTPIKLEMINRDQNVNQFENLNLEPNENPQILIVEDNDELRLFLRDLFSPSYQVICAKDGEEGKDLALKHLPDLIISDVMMPKMQGNELCKLLKNDINTSHITIILFTAIGGADSIIDGYDCGADDYIVKPFDTDVLLKKVLNIISTGENARKKFSFTDMEHSKNIYSDFDKKFLEDCKSIIKTNLDNTHFTVEFFAENLSMHRRTLLRKFNALTGKSPIDLIRHSRMTQAAKLLKEKYRVNEVALMVGYEDTKRFSQAFKQFHGVSPSNFQQGF